MHGPNHQKHLIDLQSPARYPKMECRVIKVRAMHRLRPHLPLTLSSDDPTSGPGIRRIDSLEI